MICSSVYRFRGILNPPLGCSTTPASRWQWPSFRGEGQESHCLDVLFSGEEAQRSGTIIHLMGQPAHRLA